MNKTVTPELTPEEMRILDAHLGGKCATSRDFEELHKQVRAKAAERVKAKGMTRPTPYGTLTHAISGEAIRPATAREMGDFAVAQRHGRPCLHIAHVEAGQWWEEPYVVTPTKEMFFPEDK